MTEQADFFLASSEGYGLEEPRRCFVIRRLGGGDRDDWLLVRISPSMIGQPFGLGAEDIDHVIVATRHQGHSLPPVGGWPVYVHVARMLVPDVGQETLAPIEVEEIAWAELYPTEESARAKSVSSPVQ